MCLLKCKKAIAKIYFEYGVKIKSGTNPKVNVYVISLLFVPEVDKNINKPKENLLAVKCER